MSEQLNNDSYEDVIKDIRKMMVELGMDRDSDLCKLMGWGWEARHKISRIMNIDKTKIQALEIREELKKNILLKKVRP